MTEKPPPEPMEFHVPPRIAFPVELPMPLFWPPAMILPAPNATELLSPANAAEKEAPPTELKYPHWAVAKRRVVFVPKPFTTAMIPAFAPLVNNPTMLLEVLSKI